VLVIGLIGVQNVQALILVHHKHHGAGVRLLLAASESLLLALNVMFQALLHVGLVITLQLSLPRREIGAMSHQHPVYGVILARTNLIRRAR